MEQSYQYITLEGLGMWPMIMFLTCKEISWMANHGVNEESKAYKFYEPVEGKVIINKDVLFEEAKCLNWNKKDQVILEDA